MSPDDHTAVDAHWERVYTSRSPDEVSWFEAEPAVSRRLVEHAATSRAAAIVDVGAGASALVDRLLEDGYDDVTALDASRTALDAVRARLGPRADAVTFVVHDVLTWMPTRRYDIWHDRAVFHFLTDHADRVRYVALAARAVRPHGIVVIGTFAADGPRQCSGLPVCGYTAAALAAEFAPSFQPIAHERDEHQTPAGAIQPFTWVTLERAGD